MQLSDSSIVDFSDDRSAVTLETDIVVDALTAAAVARQTDQEAL